VEETVFSVLHKKITDDIVAINGVLVSGRVNDMEEYKLLVGRAKGLSESLEHIKDLERNFLDED